MCLFNLSAEPITVTLTAPDDTAPLGISEGVERRGRKLTLAANGFAFLAEPAGSNEIDVKFGGVRKKE